MVDASAHEVCRSPWGPMRVHDRPRVLGTAHRRRRGRVAVGSQVRRDHLCELVVLDCGAGHNFELELSERRIAADLAGQLHPSSIRRASMVPGQEVAVDLRLLAGLWLRRVRVPRESGLTTAAASPIVPRSGCIQAASIRTASQRISGRVMPAAATGRWPSPQNERAIARPAARRRARFVVTTSRCSQSTASTMPASALPASGQRAIRGGPSMASSLRAALRSLRAPARLVLPGALSGLSAADRR